jgi:sulfur transfer protein SufE
MMHKDKNYVRLAKYISEQDGASVTLADLVSDLKFFKGTESQKREMLMLAKAWAATNNIIITEKIKNDIVYLSGEKMQETDLEKIIVSTSIEFSGNYKPAMGKWADFENLAKMNINFCTHHFEANHRADDNIIKGFNLVVLDVEKSIPIDMAMSLFKEYTCMFYTTKRHTEKENRYRIVLPISKTLKLDKEAHKKFYKNIFEWLPFAVDEVAHPSAKWACYEDAEVYMINGEKLFDPTNFIPDTTQEKSTREKLKSFGGDVTRLERYILANTEGRNNALLRIAMVHVDRGLDEDTVRALVETTNNKLETPLKETEIEQTIMKSVRKKISDREE